MKVQNRKCIWKLSRKSLWAYRKRNLIAIVAIALTTLLFTSLFTIALSINASYEAYQFRQCGGYNHGTFKDVTDEQAAAIAAHPTVKETGARTVIGFILDGVFNKMPAEVSYMDENCTKWSYAEPTTGRSPQNGREIAMDTKSLELLGITPALGATVELTYTIGDKSQTSHDISDTFILVGYWDYDNLMPVHYLNISREYADEIEALATAEGMDAFRTDLNVMMASAVNIRGQMEQVDTDLGYTWESFNDENSVRIGVNWGYTSAQIDSSFDFETAAAIAAFIVLVIFTGYLIIYNIFQISVTGDIRFYGLLKTIGVTPKQLHRIIHQQASMLCLIGIPIGILLGYCVGAVLTPIVLASTTLGTASATISASPVIFVGSAAFALVTVLFSCAKPGRIAARVSPVEATKYTENLKIRKKSRSTRGASVQQMAFGNLGRNKSKTFLVIVSLSLSVVLFNVLYTFVGGFDMERYLNQQICADFILSSTDYFRFERSNEFITSDTIEQLKENTRQTIAGSGYKLSGYDAQMYMSEETWRNTYSRYCNSSQLEEIFSKKEKKDGKVAHDAQIEGLDAALFEKLKVIDGDLSPMLSEDGSMIAISVYTDDYGNVENPDFYPSIGDTVTVTYLDEVQVIDSRTGKPCSEDTPEEYLDVYIAASHDVDYTVCALVDVPYSMSFRYSNLGYMAVLPAEVLQRDSGQTVIPLFYLFDTPDEAAEQEAEHYLSELTAGDFSVLMYESKETTRAEFRQFQSMFALLGGVLCAIIGLVGILNFFNAIMTSILSRLREFAVLQAVGMTGRQLRSMLICEGMLYALGAVCMSLVLSLILSPLAGRVLETMFWFFNAHFTVVPVLIVIPFFVLLGLLIPIALYGQTTKRSVVERLRETE